MKKLFVLFATATLLVGVQACKQKPADETSADMTDSSATTETVAATADSAMNAVAATADSANTAVKDKVAAGKDAVKDATKK